MKTMHAARTFIDVVGVGRCYKILGVLYSRLILLVRIVSVLDRAFRLAHWCHELKASTACFTAGTAWQA